MKKWLVILGMITCMLGLTACGAQKKDDVQKLPAEDAQILAENLIGQINQVVLQQAMDQYSADPVIYRALTSWDAALKDMGSYMGVASVETDVTMLDASNIDEGVIKATVEGAQRQAIVEIIIEDNIYTSITTNVVYTFGETMQKAALNTLLGMGTVFSVLILISLVIWAFNLIPKVQAKLTRKPVKEERAAAVDNTIAQIIEKEELTDDLELVAVIAAAIAASQGADSTDGFVVRSIRRAGNHWK